MIFSRKPRHSVTPTPLDNGTIKKLDIVLLISIIEGTTNEYRSKTMSEFTAMTATIPTSTLGRLEEKISKINAKGGTFRYRVVGTTTITRHIDYEGVPRVANIHASIVEVIGQQNGVDGASWNFVAHLDHITAPAVVTSGVKEDGIVAEYRHYTADCQHCNQKRMRRYTYIAENVDTGNRVQVGSTCLKAYFGNATAESLISAATFLRQIPAWFDDDEFRGTKRPFFQTMAALKGAAQSVLNRGYHKTTGVDTPTKNEAPFIKFFSDEAIDLAEKAMTWIKSLDADNDYLLNCQASVSEEWIDYRRHGGWLCSIISSYQKSVAKQAADKMAAQARTEDCPDDGPKPTKRHQIIGTVIAVNEVDDSYYGLRVTLLMTTQGGYKLFGTCPRPLYDVSPGDSIAFDCKIKFRDTGYGYINRPTKAKILTPA